MIHQQIKELLKNEKRPLFTLAEFICSELSVAFTKSLQEFTKSLNDNSFDVAMEISEKSSIKIDDELQAISEIYQESGRFMALIDNFYVQQPKQIQCVSPLEGAINKLNNLYSVGHTDSTPLSAEESGIDVEVQLRYFNTMTEAENFLNGHLMNLNPDMVEKGKYFIDGPADD